MRERASHTTSVLNFHETHSESDPTRAIPAEGSSASVQIRMAPQRERSDTHDPRRGFVGQRPPDPPPVKKKIDFKGCELGLGKLGCVSKAA